MTKLLRLAPCLIVAGPIALLHAADPAPADSTTPPPVVIERAPENQSAPNNEAALRAENQRLAEAAAAEKKRADEAIERLNTLNAGVERLLQEKATLTAELTQARTTETALRQRLDTAEKAMAAVPADVAARLDEATRKLAEADQRRAALEADNRLLKTAAADQVRLTAELETIRQEKAAREAAEPSLQDLRAKLADAQSKLDTSLRSYSLLQTENEQLKAASQAAPPPQPAVDTAPLTAEIEKLRQANSELTARLQSEQGARASELDALKRENADLQTKLAAVPADRSAELTAKLADTENKLETTLRSFTQLRTENDQLKESAGELEALRGEVDALRRDKETLEGRLAAVPATPTPDVSARLAETEGKLNTVLRSYSLLQAENDRLKSEASTSVRSAEAISAKAAADAAVQISALFDELRQTKAQATTLAAENAQLKTRLALAGSPPGSVLASPVRPGTAAATAAVATPPPAPTPAAPRTHTVVAGDTLAKLARNYYGNANRWDEILRANRDVIHDENVLPVGATLKIP